MKRLLFIIIATVYLPALYADHFTDTLTFKEFIPDIRYYQLLPPIDDKKPDLTFLRSREPTSMSLEEDFLEMIERATAALHFIETGTYLGDTTQKASEHFAAVSTIELDKKLYQKAQKRFKRQTDITLYQGDSAKLLPELLENQTDKLVIFLDAHYSLGETAQGPSNTPILHELEVIQTSGIDTAILIIDDIRMFYTPITSVAGTFIEAYPTLNEIVEQILAINPDYQCAVIYDTLVAFPAQEHITVSPVVHAATMSRLYDGNNYQIEDVLAAELTLAKAQGKEHEALTDLAARWIEPWSEPYGLSRHNALWYGLISLAYEKYDQATAYLTAAKKRGLPDWRIDWYLALAQAQIFFGIR